MSLTISADAVKIQYKFSECQRLVLWHICKEGPIDYDTKSGIFYPYLKPHTCKVLIKNKFLVPCLSVEQRIQFALGTLNKRWVEYDINPAINAIVYDWYNIICLKMIRSLKNTPPLVIKIPANDLDLCFGR